MDALLIAGVEWLQREDPGLQADSSGLARLAPVGWDASTDRNNRCQFSFLELERVCP